jgi:hypothetical protein
MAEAQQRGQYKIECNGQTKYYTDESEWQTIQRLLDDAGVVYKASELPQRELK